MVQVEQYLVLLTLVELGQHEEVVVDPVSKVGCSTILLLQVAFAGLWLIHAASLLVCLVKRYRCGVLNDGCLKAGVLTLIDRKLFNERSVEFDRVAGKLQSDPTLFLL